MVYVIIRLTEGWLLWKLCSPKMPESIGKWSVPSAEVLPGETPLETAIRTFREDVKMEPDPKRLTHLFQQNAWAEDRLSGKEGQEATVHFFEYRWSPQHDEPLLPEFVPDETVSKRKWISARDGNPDFSNKLLECAAHYSVRTWRLRGRKV